MTTPSVLRDIWLSGAAALEMAKIDDSRFEAEVLLRHATGLSRAQLYASLTDVIDSTARQRFESRHRRTHDANASRVHHGNSRVLPARISSHP